jgi:hypothetical protein
MNTEQLNEYECLKNIYARMIMLTSIAPLAILLFGPFLLIYILIPNIFIYFKYYKKNAETIFDHHIKNIMRQFVIAMVVLFISFLPLLSMVFINYQNVAQGTALFILMVSVFTSIAGLLISWAIYLHQLIKSSNTLDKSSFK